MNPKPRIPHSREAEEATLGAILINPEAITDLYFLRSTDFYDHRNQWVWESFNRLHEKRAPIDLMTVSEELDNVGKLAEVGGSAYLTSLINQVPSSLNSLHYARIIQDHSIRRGLIRSANSIAQLAYDESKDLEEVRAKSDNMITEAIRFDNGEGESLANALSRVYDKTGANADRLARGEALQLGLSTGLIDLDRILLGIESEELIYIAAKTGQGKSTLLLNIALHNARQGKRVALFIMESSADEVARRLIAQMAGIDSQKIKTGNLEEREWPLFTHTIEALEYLPIEICDSTDLTPAKLRAKCLQMSRANGLDLVIVDYVQLMEAGFKMDNRTTEVSYISRQLKVLTKTIHAPIIAAAQFSREIDRRTEKRPVLSDLKESGSLEQDANCVILLHNEENPDSQRFGVCEAIVAKRRDGMTGSVDLIFRKAQSQFVNATSKVFTPNVKKPDEARVNYAISSAVGSED